MPACCRRRRSRSPRGCLRAAPPATGAPSATALNEPIARSLRMRRPSPTIVHGGCAARPSRRQRRQDAVEDEGNVAAAGHARLRSKVTMAASSSASARRVSREASGVRRPLAADATVRRSAVGSAARAQAGRPEPPTRRKRLRRRADRAAHHRREGARAGVAELGGDARHRQPARRQRHGARQQHLLAPLHERGSELAAKEARHRARAGAGVGRPGGERAMRDGLVDALRSQSRRRRFSCGRSTPSLTGAARRSSSSSRPAMRRSRCDRRASSDLARRSSATRSSSRASASRSARRLRARGTAASAADSAAERAGPQRPRGDAT